MAQLIEQFQNLEGDSIAQRKKSLHALLKNPLLKEQQEDFVKNLSPRNFLEELFRVEILIYLRRTSDLLEILKQGNEIYVSKVIKEAWLFKEAFNELNAEEFVNNFLPNMSYALRMKVLKRVSINLPDEKVNTLFDALLKRYGLFIAKQFLAFCTVDKIKNVLKSNEIELPGGQLQIFFKKDKTLIPAYIDELKNQGKVFHNNNLLKYIAERDVKFFLQLKDQYKIKTDVGTRTTKKIIDLKKDDIIANPKEYVDILKKSVVTRRLKKDFKEFYYQLFPKSDKPTPVVYNDCQLYLRYAPKRLQYAIMADTFKRVYNEDIENNDEMFAQKETIELMSWNNSAACAEIANIRYEKTNDNLYLKFMPLSKSIPILKEKINLTSNIYDRSRLIDILVEACKHHHDLKALEGVMTYFCKRHRNDDSQNRSQFMYAIIRNFEYEELSEIHWNCLIDLHKIQRMKNEYVTEKFILFRYMEYLIKNNKPFKEYFDLYVKDLIDDNIWLDIDERKKYNPDLLKSVILELVEITPKHFKDHLDIDERLTAYILQFNKMYPEKAIDLYGIERLTKILIKKSKTDHMSYQYLQNIKSLICSETRNETDNEVLNCYFTNLKDDVDESLVKWFLKHEVDVLVKYFNNVITGLVKCKINFWYLFKKYSHLDFDKKSISYLQHVFNEEQKNNEKTNLIKPLVLLLSTDDYIRFTDKYLPKKEKVDLLDEEARDLYNLQCEIAKSFKYVVHMPTALPTILKYCIGDYLQAALSSLYSAIFRVPENQLSSALECLSKRAVSVRKHALFLSCNILEQNVIIDLLKKSGSQEKNVSVQKHLYSTTIKYFLKNPSEKTWNLVKEFINFIDKSDVESLKMLTETTISKKYQHIYWQAAWEYIEKNKSVLPKYPSYLGSLLTQVNKDLIILLPVEFLQKIIEDYFLTGDKLSKENAMVKFAVIFLFYEKRIDTFKLLFSIISKYKSVNWNNTDDLAIRNIFNEIISQRHKDCFTKENLEKISSHWNSIFTPIEYYKEDVTLKVLKMHKESNDLKSFAESVAKFVEDNISAYSPIILPKLSGFVRYTTGLVLEASKRIEFIEYLLQCSKSNVNCILCLELLTVTQQKEKDKQKNLLAQIAENQEPCVQILYNAHIRSQ